MACQPPSFRLTVTLQGPSETIVQLLCRRVWDNVWVRVWDRVCHGMWDRVCHKVCGIEQCVIGCAIRCGIGCGTAI